MRKKHLLLLALAPLAAGCILTSGQITVSFDLNEVAITNPASILPIPVDLNNNGDYNDHKDKLKDISDVALLGEIHNDSVTQPIQVEFWMIRDGASAPLTLAEAQVRAQGIRIWGPFDLAADASVRIDWDASAALINDAGIDAVLEELRGDAADGEFVLYLIGNQATYQFHIHEGVIVLVMDAGV